MASKTFGQNTHLLLQLFQCMDYKELLLAGTVSKFWLNVINSNRGLMKRLFFEPDHQQRQILVKREQIYKHNYHNHLCLGNILQIPDSIESCRLHPCIVAHPLLSTYHIHHPDAFLMRVPHELAKYAQREQTDPRGHVGDFGRVVARRFPTWLNMLICQPPVPWVAIHFVYEHWNDEEYGEDQSCEPEYVKGKLEVGVRWIDIVLKWKRFELEDGGRIVRDVLIRPGSAECWDEELSRPTSPDTPDEADARYVLSGHVEEKGTGGWPKQRATCKFCSRVRIEKPTDL